MAREKNPGPLTPDQVRLVRRYWPMAESWARRCEASYGEDFGPAANKALWKAAATYQSSRQPTFGGWLLSVLKGEGSAVIGKARYSRKGHWGWVTTPNGERKYCQLSVERLPKPRRHVLPSDEDEDEDEGTAIDPRHVPRFACRDSGPDLVDALDTLTLRGPNEDLMERSSAQSGNKIDR